MATRRQIQSAIKKLITAAEFLTEAGAQPGMGAAIAFELGAQIGALKGEGTGQRYVVDALRCAIIDTRKRRNISDKPGGTVG